MNTSIKAIATFVFGACFAPAASAFVSGSTGADGAFNPAVNTTVTLPPSGIFNFTSVNIPVGVTVAFRRNTANTPVVILATGDVVIGGLLDVSGGSSPVSGSAGDGSAGTPGVGGPGGFDGGRGGPSGSTGATAGDGLGPGGGGGGAAFPSGGCLGGFVPGAGGGFNGVGASISCGAGSVVSGGASYGLSKLLPLIGGSGGGGGAGGASFPGTGGGGGGGAILIAATGTVTVNGTLAASGGSSGVANFSQGTGASGGGGSGGAIRIVATTMSGNGAIGAGGGGGGLTGVFLAGGSGAAGRIRLEAEIYTRTAGTTPTFTFAPPGPVFVVGAPSLSISSVAGVSAPATPTGGIDVALPSTTPNPVTVVLTTTGVPVGTTVQLRVTPARGATVTTVSQPTTGTTTSATASVAVTFPPGPSVLQAQTTFTVIAALGDLLRNFAGNERVEKITLSATLGGKSKATLITVSGKEYDAPAEALRIAALGY